MGVMRPALRSSKNFWGRLVYRYPSLSWTCRTLAYFSMLGQLLLISLSFAGSVYPSRRRHCSGPIRGSFSLALADSETQLSEKYSLEPILLFLPRPCDTPAMNKYRG